MPELCYTRTVYVVIAQPVRTLAVGSEPSAASDG